MHVIYVYLPLYSLISDNNDQLDENIETYLQFILKIRDSTRFYVWRTFNVKFIIVCIVYIQNFDKHKQSSTEICLSICYRLGILSNTLIFYSVNKVSNLGFWRLSKS